MTYKVTASTMGVSSPASVAAGTGYYRYRGNQPEPPPRSEPLPQNIKATAGKRERFARYCALRLDGKSRAEAAQEIGVHISTARYYEADFQEWQDGETDG